jgi:hypothetical protein
MKTAWLAPRDPRWTAALAVLAHDVYHLPEYVELAAGDEGGEAVAFWAEHDGHTMLVPLLERRLPESLGCDEAWRDAAGPYGYPAPLLSPGADVGSFVSAMSDAASDRGLVTAFLRLHPLLGPGGADWSGGVDDQRMVRVEHGQTVFVDLALDEQQQWSQVRSRLRSQIRKLTREGFSVAWNDWSRYGEFLAIYEQTMRQVAAGRRYFFAADYFYGLKAALGDRLHLGLVEAPGGGGEVAAAAVFTEVDGLVEYHLGGTADDWRRAGPSRLLFDSARRFFGAEGGRGNRALHLGGGLGGGEDSLFVFKAGFSKCRARFETLRWTLDPDANLQVESVWRKVHRTDTFEPDFFPRYRQLPPTTPKPDALDARPVCS